MRDGALLDPIRPRLLPRWGRDAVRPAAAWRAGAWVWSLLVFLLLSGVTILDGLEPMVGRNTMPCASRPTRRSRAWGVTLQTAAPHLLKFPGPVCATGGGPALYGGLLRPLRRLPNTRAGRIQRCCSWAGWESMEFARRRSRTALTPAIRSAMTRLGRMRGTAPHGDGRDIVGGPRVGKRAARSPLRDAGFRWWTQRRISSVGRSLPELRLRTSCANRLGALITSIGLRSATAERCFFQSNPENVAATTQTAEGRLRQSARIGPGSIGVHAREAHSGAGTVVGVCD